MYSIRQRTLTEQPDSFDFLFSGLFDPVIHSHGIGKLFISLQFLPQIGDEFLSNLISGIKCLIHSIWNQNKDEPGPVAFVYVLVSVLHGLVPLGVVKRRKDEINEVISELP